MNFRKIVLCLVALVEADPVLDWINGGYPKSLEKTMALATNTAQLMSSAGNSNIVLILPSNDAWNKQKELYKKISSHKENSVQLILDAAAEVDHPITSFDELYKLAKTGSVMTLAGTPVVAADKSKHKFKWGELKQDGTVAASSKSITIDPQPVATFPRLTIFQASSFSLPPKAELM